MSQVLLRYRGREISAQEAGFIQQLIDQHPGLSRRRLSVELCRAWNWTQSNGQWRDMVARSLMLQLHRAGHIRLPSKRLSPPNNVVAKRAPQPTLPLWEQPRQCSLRELGPLEKILEKEQFRCFSCRNIISENGDSCPYCGWKWK